MSDPSPVRHLRSLTSLRFFAALMVVLLHIGQNLPPFPNAAEVFGMGYLGVTFFFLLSGFVLTWTYVPGDSAVSFYGRRFARVWPLHAGTTLIAGILIVLVGKQANLAVLPFVITLTHGFIPNSSIYYSFNSPSWSLSCEAFFYAIFPALIAMLWRVKRPLAWAAITLGAIAVATGLVFLLAAPVASLTGLSRNGLIDYTINIFPAYRAGEFILGMTIGIAIRRGWRCRVAIRDSLALAVVGLIALTSIKAVVPPSKYFLVWPVS